MDSQFLIKSLLALGVVLMGVMLLRNSGGAKHMAGRRIVTLAFVVFALVTLWALAVVLTCCFMRWCWPSWLPCFPASAAPLSRSGA